MEAACVDPVESGSEALAAFFLRGPVDAASLWLAQLISIGVPGFPSAIRPQADVSRSVCGTGIRSFSHM